MRSDWNGSRTPMNGEMRHSFDDWTEPGDMLEDPDLELITDYLTEQLPPERVAEVTWRLEHDAAFRELAAPLVLAWTVPPLWQRDPISSTEVARCWDDFAKRAGFVRQPTTGRRRRWIGGAIATLTVTAALAVAVASIWKLSTVSLASPRTAVDNSSRFIPVADSGGWMSVGPARVYLDPGARLRWLQTTGGYGDTVRLEGGARFMYRPQPERRPAPGFVVLTDVGIVSSQHGLFAVHARRDTTDVEVLGPTSYPPSQVVTPAPAKIVAPPWMPEHVMLGTTRRPYMALRLLPGEIGRIQRGKPPIKVRAAVGLPLDQDSIMKLIRKYSQ